jgi:hypothetical protein
MLRPIQAIWWREWRESWFALPVAVGFTLAGRWQGRATEFDHQLDYGLSAMSGALMGLSLAMAVLLLFINSRREMSLTPPRDLLRLPVGTLRLGGSILAYRLGYFVLTLLAVRWALAWTAEWEPEQIGPNIAVETPEEFLYLLLDFADVAPLLVVLLLALQAVAWCSGRFAPYLLLPAAVGLIFLYVSDPAFYSLHDYRVQAFAAAAAIAVALAGFHAHRRGWYSGIRLLPNSRARAGVFQGYTTLVAQRRYELARISRWYAAAAAALLAANIAFEYSIWNPDRTFRIELYQHFENAAGHFALDATVICGLLGLYWAHGISRVNRGAESRYFLFMPAEGNLMAAARFLAILQCLVLQFVGMVLVAAGVAALAAMLGAPVEVLPHPQDGQAAGYGPLAAFGEMTEYALGGMALGVFAALYGWAFVPLWLISFFVPFIDFWHELALPSLHDSTFNYARAAVWLLPWLFIPFALRRPARIPKRDLFWIAAYLPPSAYVVLIVFARAEYTLDLFKPSDWLLGAAIVLLPVAAYLSWIALFTRMRGR